MATERCSADVGYNVPIQLYAHTEALEALLMPDSGELPSSREVPVKAPNQSHHGVGDGLGIWVSPPALSSLREQARQLQHQKRTKQRQVITLDASPSRFELPEDVQRLELGLGPGRHTDRTYQLVGATLTQANAATAPLRRDRDGGVLVPLRMMASLAISEGGVSATGAQISTLTLGAGPSSPLDRQQPEQPGALQDQQREPPLALPGPSVGSSGPAGRAVRSGSGPHVTLDPAAGADRRIAGGVPRQRQHSLTEDRGAAQELRTITSLQRRSIPSTAAPSTALITPSPSAPLSADYPYVDFGAAYELPHQRHSHQRPQQLAQQPPQEPPQQHQLPAAQAQQLVKSAQMGAGQPSTAHVLAQAEDDGDGAMLIDMGSADRAAEGALLPTPERPRAAGAAAGWDALRGFGLGLASGSGAEPGNQVAATMALLSSGRSSEAAAEGANAMQAEELQQPQQQPETVSVSVADARAAGTPPGEGEMEAADRSPVRGGQLRPSASMPAAGRAAGALAGEAGDEGFDADDEGETARRDERVHAAARLAGRSIRVRPLPGLTTSPWAPLSWGPQAASQGRHCPAGHPGLPPAQAGALPDMRQSQPSPAGSGLDACMAQLSVHGSAGVTDIIAGLASGGDPALAELLKLKVSLRRTVQGGNARSIALILSLMATLPATPGLLADSQVAALVSPLQQHADTQVATAARHLITMWKSILKAAVRQQIAEATAAAAVAGQGGPVHAQRQALAAPSSHGGAPSGSGYAAAHSERDVPMSEEAPTRTQQRPASGVQPLERHLRVLGLACSRSDTLAQRVADAAAAVGVAAAGRPMRHSPPNALALPGGLHGQQPAEPSGQSVGVQHAAAAMEGGEAQDAPGEGRHCEARRLRDLLLARESLPSDSRTVTEAEAGGHTSEEPVHEDGGVIAADAGVAARLNAATDLGGLNIGDASGSGAQAAGTAASPPGLVLGTALPEETDAGGGVAGASAGGGRRGTDGEGPAIAGPYGTHTMGPHAFLLPAREAGLSAMASIAVTTPQPALSSHTLGTEGALAGARDNDGRARLAPVFQASWCPGLASPGCAVPLPELTGPEALPAVLRSPGPAAIGPPTPTGLLLVPPPLAQPSCRKRKGDRPGARRRSVNPSKRAASSSVTGQFAGPRPVHPSRPVALVADGTGSPSDDQRPPPPSQSPHGPVTGHKTPARASLLGLHAPHSKRPRHHAGGAAGQHSGAGGHHTATQVRRMSLMLGSLDLGGGAGEGGEAAADKVLAAMEGDADADADMGSQDDGAAMLTSDDDMLPAAGAGGAPPGSIEDTDAGCGSSGRREGGRLAFRLRASAVAGPLGAPAVVGVAGAAGGPGGGLRAGDGLAEAAQAPPPPSRVTAARSPAMAETAAGDGVGGGTQGGFGMGPMGQIAYGEQLNDPSQRRRLEPELAQGECVDSGAAFPGRSAKADSREVPGASWHQSASQEPGSTVPAAGSGTSTTTGTAAEAEGSRGAAQAVSAAII